MKVTIFVEGGGQERDGKARCREGFSQLLAKIVPPGRSPEIRVRGSRSEAFKSFRTALDQPDRETAYLLLVDAEEPVKNSDNAWAHVAKREGDHWERPVGASDDALQFMAVTTETWLVADPEALSIFYGQGFKESALPRATDLETTPKPDVNSALEKATKLAKTKGAYTKPHGWQLVGKVDPAKIRARCPRFGARFLDHVAKLSTEA